MCPQVAERNLAPGPRIGCASRRGRLTPASPGSYRAASHMPKRAARRSSNLATTVLLAAAAIGLFLAGEIVVMTRTDSGRLMAARMLHIGDPADVTAIVTRLLRR